MIKKVGSEWEVVSEKTGKSLGKYKTKAEAEKKLRQIEYFKHQHDSYASNDWDFEVEEVKLKK